MAFTSTLASLIVNVVVNTQRVQANLNTVRTGLTQTGQAANQAQLAFAKIRTAAAGLYIARAVFSALDNSLRDVILTAAKVEQSFIHIRQAADFSPEKAEAFKNAFYALADAVGMVKIEDLQKIALTAAQAGLQGAPAIIRFTDSVARAAAVSESLDAEGLAKFFLLLQDVFDRNVGVVDLYSNALNRLAMEFRTNESEIVAVTTKITGTGAAFGLSEQHLLAWSTATRALGITAERASGSLTNFFDTLRTKPEQAATAVGLDPDKFKELLNTNPNEALLEFLKNLSSYGKNSTQTLINAGIESKRTRDTLLILAKGYSTLTEALRVADEGMQTNEDILKKTKIQADSLNASINKLHNTWTEFKSDTGDLIGKPVVESMNAFLKILRAPIRYTQAVYAGAVTNNGSAESIQKNKVAYDQQYYDRYDAYNIKGKELDSQIADVYKRQQDKMRAEQEKEYKATEETLKERAKVVEEEKKYAETVEDIRAKLIPDDLEIKLTELQIKFKRWAEALDEAGITTDKRIAELKELEAAEYALIEAEQLDKDRKEREREEKHQASESKHAAKEIEDHIKHVQDAEKGIADILATDKQSKILNIESKFDGLISKIKEVNSGIIPTDIGQLLQKAFNRDMLELKNKDQYKISSADEVWKKIQEDDNKSIETELDSLKELQDLNTTNDSILEELRKGLPPAAKFQ